MRKASKMNKPFKTAEEQLSILKSRGLKIIDENNAKTFLIRRNYYSMINGYGQFFQSSTDVYIPNTTLLEIEKVYIFDKGFKSILYSHIMEVEKYLKATLAYYFCLEYPNPNDYLLITSYQNQRQHATKDISQLISNLQKVISDYSKSPNAIQYYLSKYGFVPLWVVIQYMFLGDVIKMFEYSSPRIQNNVSKEFAVFLQENTGNSNAKLFGKDLLQMLRHIKTIRNAVAHDNNIFFIRDRFNLPYIPEIHIPAGIDKSTPRNDIYQTILIMKCLISPREYSDLLNRTKSHFEEFDGTIDLIDSFKVISALGFPKDWYNKK